MPEVGDLTPSKHEPRGNETKFHYIVKKYVRGPKGIVLSRGKEPPKAGLITGVKS